MKLIKILILVIAFSNIFSKRVTTSSTNSSKQEQVLTLINKNAPCEEFAKVLDSATLTKILGAPKPVKCNLNCAAAKFKEYETSWNIFLLYARTVENKPKALVTALGEKVWAWKDC